MTTALGLTRGESSNLNICGARLCDSFVCDLDRNLDRKGGRRGDIDRHSCDRLTGNMLEIGKHSVDNKNKKYLRLTRVGLDFGIFGDVAVVGCLLHSLLGFFFGPWLRLAFSLLGLRHLHWIFGLSLKGETKGDEFTVQQTPVEMTTIRN